MSVEAIIADFNQRGIRLIPNPPKLAVEPASKLTDEDRQLIRQHKPVLLAHLRAQQERNELDRQAISDGWKPPDPYERARALAHEAEAAGRDLVDHLREHAPDLLAEPEDRRTTPAESVAGRDVQPELSRVWRLAEPLGWPRDRIFNASFWPHTPDHPRGLGSVLAASDRVVEVRSDYLVIESSKGERSRFTKVVRSK